MDEHPSGGPSAADVFSADLRPRPGGRLRHGARIAGAFVAELLLELVPAPSVHDVVVTRRDDGTEVLRIPAGVPLQAGDLLAQIRSELAGQEADAFLAGWSESAQKSR